MPPRVVSLLLFASFFTCSCMSLLVCLCHQALLISMISCGFTPIFIHEILSPFLGTLLDGMCRLCSNIMDPWAPIPNPHISFEDTLSLSSFLIKCLFAYSHAFFLCLFVSLFPFLCLLALFVCSVLSMIVCYFSACLLLVFPLFVACTQGAWAKLLNASKRAKISRLGGFTSPWAPVSLSIAF